MKKKLLSSTGIFKIILYWDCPSGEKPSVFLALTKKSVTFSALGGGGGGSAVALGNFCDF